MSHAPPLLYPAVLVRPRGPRPRFVRGFTSAQADKARLLIEDGAIMPWWPGHAVYRVVSSDGTTRYLTHPNGCTCPAGLHAARCYHSAAAALLEDARGSSARHYRAARAGRGDPAVLREFARAASRIAREAPWADSTPQRSAGLRVAPSNGETHAVR